MGKYIVYSRLKKLLFKLKTHLAKAEEMKLSAVPQNSYCLSSLGFIVFEIFYIITVREECF